jgi:hypothetical protein
MSATIVKNLDDQTEQVYVGLQNPRHPPTPTLWRKWTHGLLRLILRSAG